MSGQDQSFGDAMNGIWRAKVFILVGMFLGLIVAIAFLRSAIPQYKAEMIVSPANPMNGAEVSSLLADDNLFALRYMMQRVGVSNSSDFLRFENTVRGPSVAAELLKQENVRRGLAMDQDFHFVTPDQEWSPAKFADYISKRVRLEPVGATSLRKMVYFHPDPAFASEFLILLHGVTDTIIRQNIREDAEKRVQYLKNAIVTTNNPEHRRALTTLLLEQERLRMLVSIEQPYAAAVIEPASSSFKPEWPDRALMFLAFMLGGGVLGFALHACRHAKRY